MSDAIQPISQQETDLLKIAQLNTMNINGLSQQMGLVNARLNEHEQKLSNLENRVAVREQREILNSAQCRQMRRAVICRVNSVLGIEFDGKRVADKSVKTDVLYRGGFISRLYADAKAHSKMGESYRDTLQVDYDEVMDYINAWYPEVEGKTDGYKHYLDIRREERQKHSA